MKKIPLTQGQFAIVDDEDFEELAKFKWCVHKSGNRLYAKRNALTKNGAVILMHRFLLNATDSKFIVDHIDGNGLNNLRSNIRACSNSQNLCNRGANKNNSTGMKGVYALGKRWTSKIKTNMKSIHLGVFDTKEDAALAYDMAAKKYHGEFAKTNF